MNGEIERRETFRNRVFSEIPKGRKRRRSPFFLTSTLTSALDEKYGIRIVKITE